MGLFRDALEGRKRRKQATADDRREPRAGSRPSGPAERAATPGLMTQITDLAEESKRLAQIGLAGQGTITEIRGGGADTTGVCWHEIELTVAVAGRDPYPAVVRVAFDPSKAAGLAVDTTVPVRVDPGDPSRVLIAPGQRDRPP